MPTRHYDSSSESLRDRHPQCERTVARWGGIWFTNIVVFALWYWELIVADQLPERSVSESIQTSLFTQMRHNHGPEEWKPGFFDYLYLAFTNATSFSPTDTMPLSRWGQDDDDVPGVSVARDRRTRDRPRNRHPSSNGTNCSRTPT